MFLQLFVYSENFVSRLYSVPLQRWENDFFLFLLIEIKYIFYSLMSSFL